MRPFIVRARAADARFRIGDAELASISTICRRLDGIPLAIELAAAHAAELGLDQLLGGLDDSFALLTRGRRTALPRHRTCAWRQPAAQTIGWWASGGSPSRTTSWVANPARDDILNGRCAPSGSVTGVSQARRS